MTTAYVGLGSNVGDRLAYLRRAVAALDAAGLWVLRTSSVYETDPVGPPQPDFLNAVAVVETSLAPSETVAALKAVEREVGRSPGERWGPREVDLDLLLHGDAVVDEPGVRVPHPELMHRAFVLVPLLEVAPDLELPSGEPLALFQEPDPRGVRLFAAPLRAVAT